MIIIFDLDDTLVKRHTATILPGRGERTTRLIGAGDQLFIATNQAGPAYRLWLKATNNKRWSEYPDLATTVAQVGVVADLLKIEMCCVALHPGRREIAKVLTDTGLVMEEFPTPHFGHKVWVSWEEKWRKPNPGMLDYIVHRYGFRRKSCIYVGNDMSDFDAARAAGIEYADSSEVFD